MKHKIALQFRVELFDIEPTIWRRIEVPSSYSFWDLHVAIQDSMGWLDCHLHEFTIKPRHKRKRIAIGLHGDYAATSTDRATSASTSMISVMTGGTGSCSKACTFRNAA